MPQARTTTSPTEPTLPAIPDDLTQFKSVTLDGNTVITNHDLKSVREEEEARERQKAFETGRLRRATRINMSGGVR